MNNTFISLHNQIAETESDLRLIQARKSDYVQETDIPLDLIKAERRLETRLADLRSRQAQLRNVPCPYRGLKYFDTEHAANYFGRAAMVKKLVATYYSSVTRYTSSTFLRLQLGAAFTRSEQAPRMYGSVGEAQAGLDQKPD